ncbi:MAG: class A beta-lactamase-related serine hydrolase [Saccharofermentans sp.]|nr:class A beta-lactamase-related serine hydrolase [Saccharofermentans sp.]
MKKRLITSLIVLSVLLSGCNNLPVASESASPVATENIVTPIPTNTPTLTEVPYDGSYEFVSYMTNRLFGDSFDDEALIDTYSDEIDEGVSPSEVVLQLLDSDAFLSLGLTDEEYIQTVSHALTGIYCDESLTQFWVDQINLGVLTRNEFSHMHMDTVEFGELCASYGLMDIEEVTNFSARQVLEDNSLAGPDEADLMRAAQGSSDYVIQSVGGFIPNNEVITSINEALDELSNYRVSFIMLDIESGRGLVYRQDEIYYSASSIKGPYAVSLDYYAPDIAANHINSIESLLVYSDNDAFRMFVDTYGKSYIQQWAEAAGCNVAPFQYKYPRISASQLGLLWLQNYDFFCSCEEADEFGTYFENPYESTIHSALGDLYVTRSKAGWEIDTEEATGYRTSVDAGIIYADNGPYLMVIMSDLPAALGRLEPLALALDAAHQLM